MPARILSIPPGLPFLPTLAEGILDGRIVPGVTRGGDPLALADLTVYVPTRRAAQGLTAAFAHAIGGRSAILPSVRPLGEGEAMDPFAAPPEGGTAGALLHAIDPLRRRLDLARLIRFWKSQIDSSAATALSGEPIVLPASSADALWLAEDLGALLDEAGDEEVALSALATLDIDDRLAEWWQLTSRFLSIVTEAWPAHLASLKLGEPGEAKRVWARERAARYRRDGSRGPVVVAGSTATAPATLELLAAIAELPNGAVVLPGLDMTLDEPSFARIDRSAQPSASGHPQYGLARVLAGLRVRREDVETLASPRARRERFVSDALRPAETTDLWATSEPHGTEALDGFALVEAPDERTEALAIAVAMRDALSDPKARAALTTPDRNLARRVVAELARFGIAANDSAGRPLSATAPGTLARLVLEAAFAPGDPVTLLSLLKHPLARFARGAAEARRAARTIELLALRGGTGRASAATLADLYRQRRAALETARRIPRAVRLVKEEDRDLAASVCDALALALRPLLDLRGAPAAETSVFAAALTRSLEAIASDGEGDVRELYAEEAGAALAGLLADLVAAPEIGFPVEASEWPDVFAALSSGVSVRPRAGLSSRAFVWGALEARLQDVDVMVLGGLNEGTWPQGARSDAFLSRVMRSEILLDPPERRIGLAAHDIWMALGHERVVLTRSLRSDGAPTVPSRWLQRLTTLAGDAGTARLRAEGAPFLKGAARLDEVAEGPRAPRPEPRPPLSARPRRFSVTEVETLFRDPYAVHARRVLHLQKLEPLIRAPAAAERGTLYHRILARFAKEIAEPGGERARHDLLAIAREEFAVEALPPEIEAVWWPRMETLATNVVDWERRRGAFIVRRHAELKGEMPIPDIGVMLSGEADRIDETADGGVEILDFKTGTNPSAKQARTLLSPQLALEAAMAREGAFAALGRVSSVSELTYVRLRERAFSEDRLSKAASATREAITADGLAEEALRRFRSLSAFVLTEANGFRSRARPMLQGDFTGEYDHLARAREWALGEDEDAGEGDAS